MQLPAEVEIGKYDAILALSEDSSDTAKAVLLATVQVATISRQTAGVIAGSSGGVVTTAAATAVTMQALAETMMASEASVDLTDVATLRAVTTSAAGSVEVQVPSEALYAQVVVSAASSSALEAALNQEDAEPEAVLSRVFQTAQVTQQASNSLEQLGSGTMAADVVIMANTGDALDNAIDKAEVVVTVTTTTTSSSTSTTSSTAEP